MQQVDTSDWMASGISTFTRRYRIYLCPSCQAKRRMYYAGEYKDDEGQHFSGRRCSHGHLFFSPWIGIGGPKSI